MVLLFSAALRILAVRGVPSLGAPEREEPRSMGLLLLMPAATASIKAALRGGYGAAAGRAKPANSLFMRSI